MTSLSHVQGSHEALFGLRVREHFNEGFSEQLVISLCVSRQPVQEAANFRTGCRSKLIESIFVSNIRLHFQMEIDILEISLDIWAIWHALGELANVPGELVEVFYVQAVR